MFLPRAPRKLAKLRCIRVTSISLGRGLASESYNEDTIVPDFYVGRKASKGDPSSLMNHLTEPSSTAISSTLRRPESKVPTELRDKDGILVHPSGFVIPTPGSPSNLKTPHYQDCGKETQTAAVAERVSEEASLCSVTALIRNRPNKVPCEVEQIDGIYVHPSGFTPPTAQHEFKYNVSHDSHGEKQSARLSADLDARS